MRKLLIALAFLPALACESGHSKAVRLNSKGNELMNAGKPAEAVAVYGEAVKIEPYVAKYHFNLGVAYARLRHADEAAHHFQEALRLDPGDVEASRMLSLANIAIAQRARPY